MTQELGPVFEAVQRSSKTVLRWTSDPGNLATSSRRCSVPVLRMGEWPKNQAKGRVFERRAAVPDGIHKTSLS